MFGYVREYLVDVLMGVGGGGDVGVGGRLEGL